MIIKAEVFQYTALLLDSEGRVWQVRIDGYGQPVTQLLERVDAHTVQRLSAPSLSRYVE